MLATGSRLGAYEVVAQIGAGGMGEVYQARDTKLGRYVAIKVLPEAFAHDADRLARFQREAKMLAALNHPNIATIHGLEHSNSTHYLVMELVPGETLRERIAREGAVPVEEALIIARQIAEALEAAHEKGIIHRDLKPANVKVTPEGKVKVLDFGLAKAFVGDGVGSDPSNSPTLSQAATMQGVILGTAAYMSPEQAKGKSVDKRTDVWAFGALLYEMLAGTRAFGGDDVSDTLAAVLRADPDWGVLPKQVPDSIRQVLRACLKKDMRQRVHDIADVRLAMEGAFDTPAVASAETVVATQPVGWRRVAAVGLSALVAGGIISGLATRALMGREPQPLVWLTALHPAAEVVGNAFDPDVVISPDGRRIAYVTNASGTVHAGRLYVRALDQLEPTLLANSARSPFFSPDGQWVGFVEDEDGSLAKIPVTGGPIVTIGALPLKNLPRGATWGQGDKIIFATSDPRTGLFQISAAGGEPKVLTTPHPEKGEVDHLFPEFLPGGRAVLFTITNNKSPASSQIAVLDLRTGKYRVLLQGGSNPRYSASGHIVYGVEGTLRAAAFDLDSLEVRGTPVPVLEDVITKISGAASFDVASNGTLVYLAGKADTAQRTIVWVDRQGREEAIKVPPRAYAYARLSPDGTRVALDIRDQENDIWVWNLERQTLSRLTFDPGLNRGPVWTPDGKRLAFSAQREGSENIYWQAADGSGAPEQLTKIPNGSVIPLAFSLDGSQLLFTEAAGPLDVSLLRLNGGRKPELLLHNSFNESNAEISPNGRWLAYESDESGRNEIYVRPFPDVNAGRWQVSTDGGTRPLWNPNGRELFYYVPPGTLMAVRVEPGPSFAAGPPSVIFQGEYDSRYSGRQYSVSPDGKRFLMIKDAGSNTGASPREINVVLNWTEELKHLVPAGTK
jgi:Tol biopolymer transport system component